jgi:iron complex transport system substrate-binding protein
MLDRSASGLMALAAGEAGAREIIDMAGRTVTVPDTITKVYGASPPATICCTPWTPGFSPEWNFRFNNIERPFMRPDVADLPVLGGWFARGRPRTWKAFWRSSRIS